MNGVVSVMDPGKIRFEGEAWGCRVPEFACSVWVEWSGEIQGFAEVVKSNFVLKADLCEGMKDRQEKRNIK